MIRQNRLQIFGKYYIQTKFCLKPIKGIATNYEVSQFNQQT